MPVFDYGAEIGAAYARSFAIADIVPPEQGLFFVGEDDCTNFISQCVWAAYGGWIPGFTPEIVGQNRNRIAKNIRQTGEWYGSRWHIGSNAWCRVGEFYEYAANLQKPFGPRARNVAEGPPAALDPAALRPGDVIQLVVASYTPARFGHGLYVVQTGDTLRDVLICCHTLDRVDFPFAWFAAQPDEYRRARVLRFEAAGFEK